MADIAQSLSILTVIAAAGLAAVGLVAVRNWRQPGVRGFVLSMVGASAWSMVIAINIYPANLLPAHVSMTLRNGLILVIFLGWLLFVVEYVRRERIRPPAWVVGLVLVVPVITVVLTATNPLHHLALGPETPEYVGGGPDIDWGPWHLVFMAYVFSIGLVPLGLLLRDLRSAHGPHRRQILLILAGFVVAVVGSSDYLLTGAVADIPSYVRLSPFAFLIAAGFWGLALFRYKLFDIIPVSRRTVVETIPDPVVVVDRNGLVVDCNAAAHELFGVSTTATGKPVAEVFEEHPTLVEYYREGVRGEELVVEGDSRRQFSVTTERVQDGEMSTVIVLRDITPIKRREQELTEKNEQLDRFASFVAHDLRNPLTVASLSLELAAETGKPEHFERVSGAHDRMDEMISSIRTLSRIDRGTLDIETVSLDAVARQSWSNVHTGEATLEIVDSTEFEADSGFVQHLFGNLFANAVEHAGDDVTITVGTVDDGFYVADDGPGIPEAEREKVFDRGYSSDGGTGFGLSLVETVCEAHDWSVVVTESDTGGARFEVTGVETVSHPTG